jgi:hypothetical protein
MPIDLKLDTFYWRSPGFQAWHANRAQISPAREIEILELWSSTSY